MEAAWRSWNAAKNADAFCCKEMSGASDALSAKGDAPLHGCRRTNSPFLFISW